MIYKWDVFINWWNSRQKEYRINWDTVINSKMKDWKCKKFAFSYDFTMGRSIGALRGNVDASLVTNHYQIKIY